MLEIAMIFAFAMQEGAVQGETTRLQRVASLITGFIRQFRPKDVRLVSAVILCIMYRHEIGISQLRAAKAGDHVKVENLLKRGANPNTKEIDTVAITVPSLELFVMCCFLAPMDSSHMGKSQRTHRNCETATAAWGRSNHFSNCMCVCVCVCAYRQLIG